jgi:hypothetical protein
MASIEEIKAGLSAASSEASGTVAQARAAKESADKMLTRLRAVAQGTPRSKRLSPRPNRRNRSSTRPPPWPAPPPNPPAPIWPCSAEATPVKGRDAVSVDQAKTTIRKAIKAAQDGIGIIEQLDGDIADALDLARYTTHDSRHTHVTTGLARLAEASRELEIAHRRLNASIDAGREYMKVLG